MNIKANVGIRPGNKALDYLLDHYRPLDAKLTHLVDALPDLGNQLYTYAEKEAQSLSRELRGNLFTRLLHVLTKPSSNKQRLLALCIFDLQMCTCFDEVLSCYGDKELASLLVDSLLYQATGYEASSPTETEILDEGTHNVRGIHKYVLAQKQLKHLGDTQAWMFGKEVGAIHGNPKDIAIILGVSTFSLAVRFHAKNIISFFLYGTLPTEEEQKAVKAKLEELNKQLWEMINKIP